MTAQAVTPLPVVNQPLVTLENVTFTVDGNPILRGVSAQIDQGTITALVGLNGAGKTTLLRAILREIPSEGQIRFHCRHDHRTPQPNHVGYVPQRLRLEATFSLTVRDLLAASLSRWPLFLGISRPLNQRMERMLDGVGAPQALLDRPMDRISGGEQQRVLLALALEPNPELLLLDEPAAGIDFKDQEGFYHLISRINSERGVTVILASHDLDVVHRHAHNVLCLRDGRIQCHGPPATILTAESIAHVFGSESTIFHHRH